MRTRYCNYNAIIQRNMLNVRILYFQFAVCMLIIFIMELAVGIAAAVFKSDIEHALKNSLKMSMKNYSYMETEKVAWDNVQMKVILLVIYKKKKLIK